MTDFANLGIKIDSSQVKQGVGDLDQLTGAGGRAEGSIKSLGDEASRTGAKIKGAATGAASMAASAQAGARAAMGYSAGLGEVTKSSTLAAYQAQNLAFQINDVVTGIASGQQPLRVFAQQGGQFYQIMQQSGLGVKGFAVALLEMTGVLKVTRDAELAEIAANASSAAQAVKGAAQRAAANVAAADTEIALAQAAVRTAVTSEELKLAQERLAKAHAAVALAAGEATIAETALAEAQGRAAAAGAASQAKTVVSLGRVGVALGGFAIVAGIAAAGVKSFQDQVSKSGEIDKFAEGLRLTDSQIEALGGKIKYLADGTREITGLTVTWGNVFQATMDVILERGGVTASGFKSAWQVALSEIAEFGKFTISLLLAGFAALVQLVGSLAINLGKLATGKFDELTNPLTDVKKRFFDTFNEVEGGFDKIGRRAISEREKTLQDLSDANKPPRAKKPRKQGDHGLAEALAELDAQIKGQLALAKAYQVSDVEAIKAEAHQKAEEEAIRHKGDVGLFYEKELRLAVAKRAADGAHVIADIHAEAAARSVVNDLVEQGIIPVQRMGQALDEQQKKRQLMAALAIAEEKGGAKQAADLREEIKNLSFSQGVLNDELAKEAALRQAATNNDTIAQLQLEAKMIGATNEARAVRLAQLEAEKFIRDNGIKDPQKQADVTKSYVDAAVAADDLATAQDKYNASLSYTADLLDLMDQRAQGLANTLSDAFGNVGSGLGQALTALTTYAAAQARLDQQHDAAVKAGLSDEKELNLYRQASLNNQLAGTAQLVAGLKTMFKEHSVGYRAMEAAEKAFAVIQVINTIKNVAAGAAKMFATLGPFAFPAVAAMLAVMAGLGFAGGGGSATAPTSPQDSQDAAGTGSVLGDMKAKSESIANSLQLVAANTNRDLEYSNAMLKALRNIDLGISKLAGTVAQQIQLSGSAFDTSALKLGTSSKGGGILGFLTGGLLGGLLGGSTTTRSLFDQGIDLNGGTVGDILANGISGDTYSIVEKIKKKKGFLGIGGSTKTTYTTSTGELDQGIADAVQGVIKSLRDGLVAAANVVGIQGAEAILNGFQVSIGRISFKDMTGEQIKDQLNAIFSKVGDDMAAALFPTLSAMQKVGEGLFETFIRVAKEYEAVDIALKSIGKTFGQIGVDSIAGRDALVQLFGGLDEFISATDDFRSEFLSEAEQIAPVQQSVVAEMQRLGLAGITTREQFKQVVLGLDLTTDAGRQMYASLLAVAPAFDKVLDYFDNLNKQAISGFQQTIDQFQKFVDSLTKYRAALFATDAAQGNAYASLKAKFMATAGLAASGDATALGGLQDAGQAFLTAAKNNASSLQQYYRDVALVARGVDKGIFAAEATVDYAQLQLDALQNATTILGTIAQNTQATAAALGAGPVPTPAAASGTATTSSGAPAASSSDIEALRSDMNAALQAIAVSTAETIKQLKRWDDGDKLVIGTREGDDALNVNLESWG